MTATSVRSINPVTLEVVGEVPIAQEEDVAAAVAAAASAQARSRPWPAERRRRFAALLESLLDRADEIAATVTAETGKPLLESYTAELFVSAENARWVGRAAGRALRPERLRTPRLIAFKQGHVVHEPLGVIAAVSPWNFPFAIPFTQTCAVVPTGNAAIIKPSCRAGIAHLARRYLGRT